MLVKMVDVHHGSSPADFRLATIPKGCNADERSACRSKVDHKSCGHQLMHSPKGACHYVGEVTFDFNEVIIDQPSQKVKSMCSRGTRMEEASKPIVPTSACDVFEIQGEVDVRHTVACLDAKGMGIQVEDDGTNVDMKGRAFQVEDEGEEEHPQVHRAEYEVHVPSAQVRLSEGEVDVGSSPVYLKEDEPMTPLCRKEDECVKENYPENFANIESPTQEHLEEDDTVTNAQVHVCLNEAEADDQNMLKFLGDMKGKGFAVKGRASKPNFFPFGFISAGSNMKIALILLLIKGGSCDFVGPEDRTVQKGERVVLECHNNGTTRLKWIKDGIEIFSGFHLREEVQHLYFIVKNTTGQCDLGIYNANSNTTGNYTCMQTGEVKSKTARIILESGSTEGPLENKESTVTDISWTSNPDAVENRIYPTPAGADPWVIVVCVTVSFAATVVIIACVYKYLQWKKKQSEKQMDESDAVVLKHMIKRSG